MFLSRKVHHSQWQPAPELLVQGEQCITNTVYYFLVLDSVFEESTFGQAWSGPGYHNPRKSFPSFYKLGCHSLLWVSV